MTAILADLDGTLVDTFPDLYAAARKAIDPDIDIAPEALPSIRIAAGAGAKAMLSAMTGEPPSSTVLQSMLSAYESQCSLLSYPFPGTEQWFDLGRVAVVTNKPLRFAQPVLDGLYPDTDLPLVTPEVAGVAKPDPAPILAALKALQAQPNEAIMIGDDPRDYEAAKAANVDFVAALYGYTTLEVWDTYPEVKKIYRPEQLQLFVSTA